ncbi:MAG: electron transfer flavoprotein subunit beta/FixA family protein [Armatimonadetes bacterium]|nr:electron transfer flavoprotein subunit beta/FixA family protein [Armatimonadota bacterium]
MKIVVCIKQVPDTEAYIKINSQKTSIEESGIKYIINPYDEFALEEALRIKEKLNNAETAVITLGAPRTQEALRSALALGIEKAVLIPQEDFILDNFSSAFILAKTVERLGYDLILCGKQAIDDDMAQTGGIIASLLNIPFVSLATKIEFIDNSQIKVHREIEGFTEVFKIKLPAVISAQKGLNEPRYASLMGIMQAKKKIISEIKIQDLGINPENLIKTKLTRLEYPSPRSQGKILDGDLKEAAQKLVKFLREEAKII